jgi:hypothetical protein
MMHGVYSGGASREALPKAAEAARSGAEVEKALAGL